jgi:NAD(P) transhydrogenase subunit alpha
MTGSALLPLFLLACAGGYIAARPGIGPDGPQWRMGIGGVASTILVGALVAAAEAGSATARYLALAAVLCASTAAVMALGVMERRWPSVGQDAGDEAADGTRGDRP